MDRRLCIWSWVLLLAFIAEPVYPWATSPRYRFYDEARVLQVLGPNLIKLKLVKRDKVVIVRLLGVGSPRNRERVRGLRSDVISYIQTNRIWDTARQFVRSQLRNKKVELWTRRWNMFDEKNRLLAYIIIPTALDQAVDLNAEIIKKGLGFVTRDYVHVTFARYRQYEKEARRDRRGMWRGLSIGRMSSLSR